MPVVKEMTDCARTAEQAAGRAVDWSEKNFLNPLGNAAFIEPYDTVASAVSRLAKQPATHHLPALEVATCADYGTAFWVQQFAFTLGSLVPYVAFGKFTGGTLRMIGAAARVRGLTWKLATSGEAAQILGAALYDGLKTPHPGENRAGNAMASATAFTVYEAGNILARRLPLAGQILLRPATGAFGSAAQLAVSHAGDLCSGKRLTNEDLQRAAITGAVLNSALPVAQEGICRLEDSANRGLRLGIPIERHLKKSYCRQELSAAEPELKQALKSDPWARVQTGAKDTSYRSDRDLVELSADRCGLPDLVHELKHRLEAQARIAEPGFRLAAEYLKSGQESKAWQIHRSVRLAQETRARLAEERTAAILDPAYTPADARSIKATVPDLVASGGRTYEQIWQGEFKQFKQTNGDFRPTTDFSDAEIERHLGKQRARLIKLIETREPEIAKVMERIEERQGLAPEDIASMYRDISRMIAGKFKAPDSRNPAKLAIQVLKLVADPREIRQGYHPTCSAAALEFVMYTNCPHKVVHLMSQVARSGKFDTVDGANIDLNSPEDLNLKPENYWGRSHANQIFQTTATNIHWQRQGRFLNYIDGIDFLIDPSRKGLIRYERQPAVRLNESPYRLMDYSRVPALPLSESATDIHIDPSDPYIGAQALEDIYQQIAGTRYPLTVTDKPRTAEALHYGLNLRQKSGQLPVMIAVDALRKPFNATGDLPDGRNWHTIAVTDLNPTSGYVGIFNPWGRNYQPHGLALKELWQIMFDPTQTTRQTHSYH